MFKLKNTLFTLLAAGIVAVSFYSIENSETKQSSSYKVATYLKKDPVDPGGG